MAGKLLDVDSFLRSIDENCLEIRLLINIQNCPDLKMYAEGCILLFHWGLFLTNPPCHVIAIIFAPKNNLRYQTKNANEIAKSMLLILAIIKTS